MKFQESLQDSYAILDYNLPHNNAKSTQILVCIPVNMPSSRLALRLKAGLLRLLGTLLGLLGRLAFPKSPRPTFTKTIPATLSSQPGNIDLLFYMPPGYKPGLTTYPVVLNFHGGGFVMGNPTDDARWAGAVHESCNAIFVSVKYRMAPEYPFPTAVEDGADAMLYLVENASKLEIDVTRIATSGFSAGGNLAITVPLRWQEEKLKRAKNGLPKVDFAAIVSWYPTIDYTMTREERRATCVRPEKTLPKVLYDIFDDSYLYPATIDLRNPYLSPAAATDETLMALPDDIMLYTCEYDMLQAEGERFKDRCQDILSKRVRFRMVKGVVHGWDKNPLPFVDHDEINKLYREACSDLNAAFNKQKN